MRLNLTFALVLLPWLPMFDCLPLQMLSAGQAGRISDLVGDEHQVHRLEELGLRRGALVEMIQPGTPCIVRLEGSRLCLRDGNLFSVLVTREEVA